jgi:hypothetical protein
LLLAALFSAAATPPVGPETVLLEARRIADQGDPKQALQLLEDWLRRPPARISDPDGIALHLEAARQAAAAGEPDRAPAHLATAQRLANVLSPEPVLRARLFREAARVYVQVGDFRHAAPLLTNAVNGLAQTQPDAAAEAANALGMVWLELRDPPRAIASFENALGLLDKARADNTQRVAVLVNQSNAALEAGDLPAARNSANRAQQAAEGDASLSDAANFARALVLLREVRLNEAEDILENIAECPSLSASALRGHALYLLATSRFDRGLFPEAEAAALAASEAYRAALGEWHPALARTLHTLGTIHEKLRDRPGAAAFYARAAEIERRTFGVNSVQFQATEIEQAWLDV